MLHKIFVRLFAVHKPRDIAILKKGEIGAAGAESGQPTTGVFLTRQAVVSFPVATMVVKVLWELAKKLHIKSANTPWFGFWGGIIVGALVFLINLDATDPKPKGLKNWLILLGLAVLNSLFLSAAVLGISVETGLASGGSSSPSTNAPAVH